MVVPGAVYMAARCQLIFLTASGIGEFPSELDAKKELIASSKRQQYAQ